LPVGEYALRVQCFNNLKASGKALQFLCLPADQAMRQLRRPVSIQLFLMLNLGSTANPRARQSAADARWIIILSAISAGLFLLLIQGEKTKKKAGYP
jgi:hypothetical protein